MKGLTKNLKFDQILAVSVTGVGEANATILVDRFLAILIRPGMQKL